MRDAPPRTAGMEKVPAASTKIFWAVMRSGNQHEAARRLGLSQPAVSKLLRYVEHQIGFPLFDRIKGRLHPTPEAHVFYTAIDGTFGRLEAAGRLARDLRRRMNGRITITTSSTFNLVLLPSAIAAFRQSHGLLPRNDPACRIVLPTRRSRWAVRSASFRWVSGRGGPGSARDDQVVENRYRMALR
jgi:DNA-binding transcriptional LysR family regulator